MLRLLTGDLVLDRPDDFDMADLPALTRLVHWAACWAAACCCHRPRRPALVEGLFLAYRAGRSVYQRHRSERPSEPVNICCLWIDEFHQPRKDCADGAAFREAHTGTCTSGCQAPAGRVRRLAQIAPCLKTGTAWRKRSGERLCPPGAGTGVATAPAPHNHSTDTGQRQA